jgi:hypothetical protein
MEHGLIIKVMRTLSNKLGIERTFSAPHYPSANGKVERLNQIGKISPHQK